MNSRIFSFSARAVPRLSPGQGSAHPFPFLHLPRVYVRNYAVEVKKRIYDKHIEHRVVRLVNPETKHLDPPTPLQALLESIDKKTYRLELVQSEPEAIVRLVTKEAAYRQRKQDKEAARAQRKHEGPKKQIQMSWGVDLRDLARKLEKARDEVKQNRQIDVVLAKKKGVPLPPLDKKMAKMDEIAALLEDVAVEWAPRTVGTQLAMMYFKPKSPASSGGQTTPKSS